MAYFGGSHGMRGDPGFFGTLFGAAKRVGGIALRASPLGQAVSIAQSIKSAVPPRTRTLGGGFPTPGGALPGFPTRGVPTIRADGTVGGRRRRMNAGNPKALRRAIRRQNAFVNLAKGALKNSGFKVVSTSAGKVSRATMDKAVAKAHHAGK